MNTPLMLRWLCLPLCLLACANVALSQSKELFQDDFEAGLTRWEINDSQAVTLKDSGDTEHGKVLQLAPGGAKVYALMRGSGQWRGYRIEGEVLFPTDEENYLGLIYHYRATPRRVDLGSIYIKGDDSYIRVNPRRDWNPARQMYEEYRTNLKGNDAIVIGKWQRFAAEVVGKVCHFYVGDLQTPKVTFDLYEGDTGKAGFKPREVGGAVWIDNLRVTAIPQLSYRGPRLPAGINYQPEKLVTEWHVLGPLTKAALEIETAAAPVAVTSITDAATVQRWRKFATDARGAVVTGQVNEYTGSRTVAYFATAIQLKEGETATLQFSTVDNLAVWRNGKFEGYFDRDQFAWHDFGKKARSIRRNTPISGLRRASITFWCGCAAGSMRRAGSLRACDNHEHWRMKDEAISVTCHSFVACRAAGIKSATFHRRLLGRRGGA